MDAEHLTSCLYTDLIRLHEALSNLPAVHRCAFLECGIEPVLSSDYLEWESLLAHCSARNSLLTILGIQTQSDKRFTLVINLDWDTRQRSLFSRFPDTTTITEIRSLELLSTYALILLNENNDQLPVIDGNDHHPGVATFPHHRHEKVPPLGRHKRTELGTMDTRCIPLLRTIESYLS